MKKSNRIGIGGKPIGEAMPNQRKPKYQIPCSEYTNIMNQDHAANNAKILNTDKHLNLNLALNEYKPIGKIIKILILLVCPFLVVPLPLVLNVIINFKDIFQDMKSLGVFMTLYRWMIEPLKDFIVWVWLTDPTRYLSSKNFIR